MDKPQNGLEFLEELRKRNGKKTQSFKAFSDFLDAKAREKGVPIHGQFELTPLCNFDCKMCYVHLNADQLGGREVLSVEKWKNLMHQAFEAGMISATLSGGECLAYPGFDELYLYLCSLGCEISLLTNGYLLNEKRIDFLKQHMPVGIKVTLYGHNDDLYERVTGHRVFATVKDNICKAIEAGLPIGINITPNVYMGDEVLETIRFSRSLTQKVFVNSEMFKPREETGRSHLQNDPDIDSYIRIFRLVNELDGRENKEIDEDKLPEIGGPYRECEQRGLLCGGGRSCFSVNWKGIMSPCSLLDMITSDLFKDGFKKAWEKINGAVNDWPRVPECVDCAYSEVCNRCAGRMLKFSEPGKQPLELCKRTKLFVQSGIAHIAECEEI